jgi:hypothetical protein
MSEHAKCLIKITLRPFSGPTKEVTIDSNAAVSELIENAKELIPAESALSLQPELVFYGQDLTDHEKSISAYGLKRSGMAVNLVAI